MTQYDLIKLARDLRKDIPEPPWSAHGEYADGGGYDILVSNEEGALCERCEDDETASFIATCGNVDWDAILELVEAAEAVIASKPASRMTRFEYSLFDALQRIMS